MKYKQRYNVCFILILAFSFFYIQWPIVFTTHDDIAYYTFTQLGILADSGNRMAHEAGRFYFLYSLFLYGFPYLINSFTFTKIISLLSICFSIFCMWHLIKSNFNKSLANLSAAIFFVFAQINNQHNCFTSYVFHHQITIGLILLSIDFLIMFYKTKKSRFLLLSSMAYAIPVFLYESFLMYSVLIFMISYLIQCKKAKTYIKNIIKTLVDLRYHIIFSFIFLIIYFIWKFTTPMANYDGATFSISSIRDVILTIVTIAFGLFPLNAALHNGIQILNYIELGFILKALLSGFIVLFFLKNIRIKITGKQLCFYEILIIFASILPCIPYGLTSKYVTWVKGGTYGFVGSYFSYFFIIIGLSLVLLYIYGRFSTQWCKISIFVIIFISSILTDCNNSYFVNTHEKIMSKYEAFDRVVSSDAFDKISENSIIYIPDFIGINYSMPTTAQYAQIYTHKEIKFTTDINGLDFNNNTYMINYSNDSNIITLSKIDRNFLSNEIYIYPPNDIKEFSIVAEQLGYGDILVNNSNSGYYPNTIVIPILLSKENTFALITGNNIVVPSLIGVNEKLTSNTAFQFYFEDGFYSQEDWGRWCQDKGKMKIINNSTEKQNVVFTAELETGYSAPSNITISTNNMIVYQDYISAATKELEIELTLDSGINYINFQCDAPAVNAPTDTRNLIFSIKNIHIDTVRDKELK